MLLCIEQTLFPTPYIMSIQEASEARQDSRLIDSLISSFMSYLIHPFTSACFFYYLRGAHIVTLLMMAVDIHTVISYKERDSVYEEGVKAVEKYYMNPTSPSSYIFTSELEAYIQKIQSLIKDSYVQGDADIWKSKEMEHILETVEVYTCESYYP